MSNRSPDLGPRSGPRGAVRITDRKLDAYRLVRDVGLPIKDAAARLGCRASTVHQYVADVEEAMADARNTRRR